MLRYLYRAKDQKTVKSIRHTRKHFSVDFRDQAEKVYTIAEGTKNKEYNLARSGFQGGHATYFSVRSNGEIWYMEPNFGAYIFNNKKDFFDFYEFLKKKTNF